MPMITIVLSLLLAAPKEQYPPDVQAFLDRVNAPVVAVVPGADKVRVKNDVVYKRAGDTRLLADIYSPRSAKGPLPVAIFIHGGMGPDFPVKPKEWGHYESWGRSVAALGIIGVTFNHRLGFPEPRLREAGSDLQDLIQYIRSNADELNADPDRIALLAFSAGGPLLSHALRERPPYIRGVVGFYNFLDISRTEHHSKFEAAETVTAYSPVDHIRADSPPMLVIKAGQDQIPALNNSIDTFMARALVVNAPVTLMIHPTAPHGFDNKQNDARSFEILQTTFEFLQRHLGIEKPARRCKDGWPASMVTPRPAYRY